MYFLLKWQENFNWKLISISIWITSFIFLEFHNEISYSKHTLYYSIVYQLALLHGVAMVTNHWKKRDKDMTAVCCQPWNHKSNLFLYLFRHGPELLTACQASVHVCLCMYQHVMWEGGTWVHLQDDMHWMLGVKYVLIIPIQSIYACVMQEHKNEHGISMFVNLVICCWRFLL